MLNTAYRACGGSILRFYYWLRVLCGRAEGHSMLWRMHLAGLEPATFGSVDRRSIQLS